MNKEEITTRVLSIMSTLFDNLAEDTLTPDLSFKSDLGLESIDIIDLVMAVETAYNISIDMTNAKSLTTIQDFIDYITPIIIKKQ